MIENLEKLTQGFISPRIPSDFRIHANSIVHYRYGQINMAINASDQKLSHFIQSPDGSFHEDRRDPNQPVPEWVDDPIKENWMKKEMRKPSHSKLFSNRFILLKTLRQRAKGGVYLALDFKDFSKDRPLVKQVIVKEARLLAELEPSGVDATCRIQWQEKIQKELFLNGITPEVYDLITFEGNLYLVMEKFGTSSLKEFLKESKALDFKMGLDWMIQMIEYLKIIHSKGFCLFDLSPDNILLNGNDLKLIDFEYCIGQEGPTFPGWEIGTPGFFPKTQIFIKNKISEDLWGEYRDIYSLGSILLAMASPEWYQKLLLGNFMNKQEWGSHEYIEMLPTEIKNIILRTRFIGGYYTDLDELMDELIELKIGNALESSNLS